MSLNLHILQKLIEAALAEDIGPGDITSNVLISEKATATAAINTREDIILCGSDAIEIAFKIVDPKLIINHHYSDGCLVKSGETIVTIEGKARLILTAERTALNILQHMSGIATYTNKFVKKVEGTKAKIFDTRKTLPGLREIERYSVRAGGGYNYRMGLYDQVLIKDNHIEVCGGVRNAVELAKKAYPEKQVEIECENFDQIKEALAAKSDIIMLDNMDMKQMAEMVEYINGKAKIEASGGVNMQNVREIAETGVDIISIGALTHSAPSVDIGLDFLHQKNKA